MTAAASRSPEPYEVPEGGLGSFLTATVGDWSDEALNADNYYDVVKPTADQLAQFGREEDDRIAHVATGETIIPMAVFEEDPALKEAVFNRMIDMGIDPERYIVGNELNSINPVTGQPEFFLKKIFKGIKKAVKGVVKVFKAVAPIVLSIGLSMTPLGPIVGTALGSGLGTLIQGGDLKDALKAAAIGGITAGVTSGISNVVKAQIPGGSAGGTFMEGVRGALPGPDVSIGRIFGAPADAAVTPADAAVTPAGAAVTPADAVADAFGPPVGPVPDGLTYVAGPSPYATGEQIGLVSTADDVTAIEQVLGTPIEEVAKSGGPLEEVAKRGGQLEEVVVKAQRIPQSDIIAGLGGDPTGAIASSLDTLAAESLAASDPSLKGKATQAFDRTKDFAFRAGETPGQVELAKALEAQQAYQNVVADFKSRYTPEVFNSPAIQVRIDEVARAAAEKAAADVGPGFFAKYGPSALGITGLAAAAGAFDVPELEPLDDMYGGITGMDLLAQNPLKYRTYSQRGAGYNPPPVGAAGGGSMDTRSFPRRDGAISGPGTETSDDIPAMLSDGEFVMTARAVRGAGNGSREAGMRKMYNMMSQFERAV